MAEAPTEYLRALVDSAATRNFLDKDLAERLGLTTRKKTRPLTLTLGDGRRSVIHEETMATILIGEGFEPYYGKCESIPSPTHTASWASRFLELRARYWMDEQ